MLRYCGPFAFPVSIPLFYYSVGPAGPLITIAALVAVLIGVEALFPRGDVAAPEDDPRGFRALVLIYIPLQLCLIVWAIATSPSANLEGFVVLVLSVGITTGIFGMLAAHEAVHSGDPLEAVLGTAMLTGMSYRHFRIAHLHGHHRWAATERDPATARQGEGFYPFLFRTVKEQFLQALRFERRRCARRATNRATNKVVADVAIMTAILGMVFFVSGLRELLFFVLQSAVAIVVLELFNYIAHYGLLRSRDETGKLEPFTDRHSWNSSNILANALVFNMGRHSFHHRRPTAPYQHLTRIEAAPELPAGYAGSILLALAPPLWRRLMDKRLDTHG